MPTLDNNTATAANTRAVGVPHPAVVADWLVDFMQSFQVNNARAAALAQAHGPFFRHHGADTTYRIDTVDDALCTLPGHVHRPPRRNTVLYARSAQAVIAFVSGIHWLPDPPSPHMQAYLADALDPVYDHVVGGKLFPFDTRTFIIVSAVDPADAHNVLDDWTVSAAIAKYSCVHGACMDICASDLQRGQRFVCNATWDWIRTAVRINGSNIVTPMPDGHTHADDVGAGAWSQTVACKDYGVPYAPGTRVLGIVTIDDFDNIWNGNPPPPVVMYAVPCTAASHDTHDDVDSFSLNW